MSPSISPVSLLPLSFLHPLLFLPVSKYPLLPFLSSTLNPLTTLPRKCPSASVHVVNVLSPTALRLRGCAVTSCQSLTVLNEKTSSDNNKNIFSSLISTLSLLLSTKRLTLLYLLPLPLPLLPVRLRLPVRRLHPHLLHLQHHPNPNDVTSTHIMHLSPSFTSSFIIAL